jgi:hypothetical protein
MDGKEYPVRELWEKFKKFLQQPVEGTANGISYRGIPHKMVDVLDNACQPANWKQFTDNGKPSLDAYYNDEATGTYSEWLLALYRYWREQGQSEKEAIWACVKEACESFRKHVNSYSPDAITKLYEVGLGFM